MNSTKHLTNKSYLLLHGFMSSSESYFLPDLKVKLEASGATVLSPSCPNPETPELTDWIDCAKAALGDRTEIEMIVAHSLGGSLALQLLSAGAIRANRVLIIGSSFGPEENPAMDSFTTKPLNFRKIKENAGKIYSAFSFDDPWTAPEYGNLNVKQLGAIGIVYGDQGHFELEQLPEELEQIILL